MTEDPGCIVTMVLQRDLPEIAWVKLIGSFQAIQHRVAELHVAVELAAASVAEGWCMAEESRPDRNELALLANFMASRAVHAVARETVQLHGALGGRRSTSP